nr:ead/Ea22-like family protein [uncultured Lelliottia sp.]
MSTNKQAREAAEKATHGEWLLKYGEDSFDGDDALIQCEVQGRIPVARIEGAHPESGFDADFQQEQQANAEFIAAANPATVLALLDELEAAEKRIAELEIREEGNQFLVVRHPGKAPVIKHFVGELDDYLLELNALDPLVTIDIITHRYYGVGGQWVQDADEYLAAAGITVKGE